MKGRVGMSLVRFQCAQQSRFRGQQRAAGIPCKDLVYEGSTPWASTRFFSRWANWQVAWFGARKITVRVGGARPEHGRRSRPAPGTALKAVGPSDRLRVGTSRLPPELAAPKDRPSQAYPTAQGSTTRCRCPGGSRMKDSGHARAIVSGEMPERPKGAGWKLDGRASGAAPGFDSLSLRHHAPWIAQQVEHAIDNREVLRSTRSPRTRNSAPLV